VEVFCWVTNWPNFRVRPGVKVGEPLEFSRYRRQADAMLLRTVTDEIMQAIAKLSGQEYVDIDARRAKAEMAAAARDGRDGAANQGDDGEPDRRGDGNGAACPMSAPSFTSARAASIRAGPVAD
jgi:1-acyl-sn-glycerol-3-phosphate acyltransferase